MKLNNRTIHLEDAPELNLCTSARFKNESLQEYTPAGNTRRDLSRSVSKSPAFSRRQPPVNFDIAKRRWIPSGQAPLLSVICRIHFLLSSSLSLPFPFRLFHVLTLRSLRTRFASPADGAADRPHPLYSQFNRDQIRRKRTATAAAAATGTRRGRNRRFSRDPGTICFHYVRARARILSLRRCKTKRNAAALSRLSRIRSRAVLSPLSEQCEQCEPRLSN